MEPHKGVKLVINSHVSRKSNIVYKVTTDNCIHYREMTQAFFLTNLDPDQQYFVYPVATYTMNGDVNRKLLERLHSYNRIPGNKFDVNAPKIYVDIMPNGGKSLHALLKSNTELSPQQAIAAINNLVEGVVLLHKNDIIHGDVHEHNVVIDSAGKARWIDFSEMKGVDPDNKLKMQTDVKRLIHVIKMIVGMVKQTNEESEKLDKMAYEIGKGSAPMTAMGLQYLINEEMKTMKRRRSSSRSSMSKSRSSGPLVKRLAF